jgi:stress response protein YsnF
VDVCKALRIEILIVRPDYVVDFILDVAWGQNRRVSVHVEANEEVRDQAEFHDRARFLREMQSVGRRLPMPLEQVHFVKPVCKEEEYECNRVEYGNPRTVHKDHENRSEQLRITHIKLKL